MIGRWLTALRKSLPSTSVIKVATQYRGGENHSQGAPGGTDYTDVNMFETGYC